ncbi:MAG: MFS transporter [Nocardioides sp.]
MSAILEAVSPSRLGAPFRRLLASSWISNIGDGIALAAGPLLIAALTRDPFLVALAPTLRLLPWLLFGLYAGVLADRHDRRTLMLAALVLRLVAGLVLIGAIATGHVTIGLVLVLIFLAGAAESVGDTAGSTVVPMLVRSEDIGVANARLLAGHTTLNQLVGPPIGAFLFTVGMIWPFGVEAVGLVLASVILAGVRLPPHGQAKEDRSHAARDIAEGFLWLWRHGPVRTLAIVIFTFNITWSAAWAVLVLYAQDRLGMTEVGFGLLTTAGAVGGLGATFAYDRLERRFSVASIMKACLLAEVCMHLLFALATEPWQGMAIMVFFGFYAYIWWTISMTVRQRAVPERFQGRVSSVYLVGVFGGMVVGSFIGGLIARQWGVVAPMWFAFFGTALILAAIWRMLPLIADARAEEAAGE